MAPVNFSLCLWFNNREPEQIYFLNRIKRRIYFFRIYISPYCFKFYILIIAFLFILKIVTYRNTAFNLVTVIGIQAAFIYQRSSEKHEEAFSSTKAEIA